MRRATRFGLAAAVGLAAAGGAVAQTTSTGTSSTGTSSTGLTTMTTGGGSSSGLTTTTPGLATPAALAQTADLSGVSIGQSTSPSSVDASNTLGSYYANPLFQGSAGATENTAPGGFGTPLYNTTTGTGRGVATGSARTVGGGSTGRATGGNTSAAGSTFSGLTGGTGTTGRTGGTTGPGGTSGRGGTTGGFGGTSGRGGTTGGFGGSTSLLVPNLLGTSTNSLANPVGGQVVQLPRAIAYTATMRFPVAVEAPAAVQANLQTVLDRSTQFNASRGVQVVAETGGAVTLRGAVQTEDEARLAEGMVRLTPGVRDVRNELTFPKP